jgi:GTP-binding protein
LLNGVAGRRIAKVSATPGKTRAMNVYLIPDGALVGAQHAAPLRHAPCYFLDLPGYGYAKASKAERSGFRGLLAHILDRANIVGVVWLLDVRREPSAEDLAMQDLLAARGTRVLAAITKSDKLPRGQRERAAHALRETLALDADQLIVTSARTGEGVVELRETIASLLRSPSA